MRKFKKTMSAILCAALVISLVPAGSADAAKKAKLDKKKVSVEVGKTVKVKVKNSVKKAKVTWKTSDKKVAAIAKKVTKGKKASVTIKGVAEGTAKIKATYKVGKKKTKLTCNVTVTGAKATAAPTSAASLAPSAGPSAPAETTAPTKTPTVKPTKRPTASPTPVPTPTPVPSPDAQIYKTYVDVAVDGTAEDTWEFADAMAIDKWNVDEGQEDTGNAQTSNATAKMLWTDSFLYVLVTADDPEIDLANEAGYLRDSIELFVDEKNIKKDYSQTNAFQYRLMINPVEDEENKAGSLTDKNSWDGEEIQYALTTSETGYVVEFAIPLNEAPTVGNFIGVELQINDASAGVRNGTWNLFADPANGDALPYDDPMVFGDCQFAIKKQPKVITLNLTEDDCNMSLPLQFVGVEGYETMNTLSKIEDGKLFCNTANNATVYFPEGRTVNNGENAVVKIKGTYASTDDAQTVAFRIWMVDTNSRKLIGDDPVTASNQIIVNKEDLNIAEDGTFEVELELTAHDPENPSRVDEEGNEYVSEGNCDAVMIKSAAWNAMLEDLTIESVVITVQDPIRNDVTEEEAE